MLNNKINVFLSLFKILFLKLRYFSRVRIGKRFKAIGSDICISKKNGSIKIGKSFKILKNSLIHSDGGCISIGNNCFLNRNCLIVSRFGITMEDNVSVGPNVCIYDHNHKDNRLDLGGEILIGEGSWIGAGTIILKGVHIGQNVVVAAGSIVSKDIPDGTIFIQHRK